MNISYIDIQNYRKLKSCRISLTDKETLLVGANNSGKTSAMDALIFFLDPKKKKTDDFRAGTRRILASDFTLSNWNSINRFGASWTTGKLEATHLVDWQPYCPSIDIWLTVEKSEIHRVSHVIPTLKWKGGMLGIRLIYQPKKEIENLRSDFLLDYEAASALLKTAKIKLGEKHRINGELKLSIWPKNLHNFLERNLSRYFEINAYILDPSKFEANSKDFQLLTEESVPLANYPFDGLFKVDVIDASRGFSDPNTNHSSSGATASKLSTLINKYYKRHLNPSDLPDDDDLEALDAIADAQHIFDEKLNDAFKNAIGEIKNLGYPGFNDPNMRLSSRVDPIDNLDHEAAILFDLQNADAKSNHILLSLSEKYNGLGYKNLIAMIFELIGFRDHWMRLGKAAKTRSEENAAIEPLHLVLIEEPEAHLHAQVQQVFIRKAFEVLRNHPELGSKNGLRTQMIVSTHSSYLAHEIGFECLRYFKRTPAANGERIPIAEVVDLAETFGENSSTDKKVLQTAKFVARYLKSTHCDLFFANGIILVEGAAERMLIPHFIKKHFDGPKGLNRSYISILEVGGAHAHRLKSLIARLGLPTLVITDTDALKPQVDANGKTLTAVAVRPVRGKGYKTGSHTLKDWFEIKDDSLDVVLDLDSSKKVRNNVRVAYQCGITVDYDGRGPAEAIPYTFEDAMAFSNLGLFREIEKPTGMLGKMQNALALPSLEECAESLYNALRGDKAAMALDLMFDVDPLRLSVPDYIKEGLEWLEKELEVKSADIAPHVPGKEEEKV